MTDLTHLQKQAINENLIEKMRYVLAGKPQSVLDDKGMFYTPEDASKFCLIGGVGALPDDSSSYIQAPNSLGMVLLIKPEADQVSIKLKGRFDLSYRVIPDIEYQTQSLNIVDGVIRDSQKVATKLIRHSLSFKDAQITINLNELNTFKLDKNGVIETIMDDFLEQTLKESQPFSRCFTSPRGFPLDTVDWHEGITTQEALNSHLFSTLFQDTSVFRYNIALQARLRKAPSTIEISDGLYLLEIFLVNRTTYEEARPYGITEPFLQDAQFETTLLEGEHFLLPHKLSPKDYQYSEEDGIAGYGIACSIKQLSEKVFATDSMPVYEQPYFETPEPEQVSMSVKPTFDNCVNQSAKMLSSFLFALDSYAEQWQDTINAMPEAGFNNDDIEEAISDRKNFLLEKETVADGIDLLNQHAQLLRAFVLMNQSMAASVKVQGKTFDSWRLFQLGFILTQIRSIYERTINEQAIEKSYERADVLWFATGGGKTEAYTGIICMALFYQRLMGRGYGVTAWMRFPLRMLSAQQFQRLSYIVAQANLLKQKEQIEGVPFTIGYFTGAGVPNAITRPNPSGNNIFLAELSDTRLQDYKFIKDCPYCGEKDSISVISEMETARIKHVCGNDTCSSNTGCLSGQQGFDKEIGIFVSDEECYRYLPSIMVGTIDKLAIIGLNQKFNFFFGSANHYCPEHGFTRGTRCEHNRIRRSDQGVWESLPCGNNTRTSQLKTFAVPRLMDPGFPFVVQDELHLLKGDLGNFDSHYETLLASMQSAYKGQSPKIISATATIKEYENHLLHLYLKPGRQFPMPGIKRGESFYSRKKSDGDSRFNRRYMLAILPVTRKAYEMPNFGSTQVSFRLLNHIDKICDDLKNGKMSFIEELNFSLEFSDVVLAYLEEFLNVSLIYINNRNLIPKLKLNIEGHNSQHDKTIMPMVLDGTTKLENAQSCIATIETKTPEDNRRQIIATSMISHGVDIERLNIMVLAGWPYSMSEYIQLSARSGRTHPGIVFTLLNYPKLYEQNVYLNFNDYHFFMERLVESVAISRLSPNILRRTLPGVISAVILNWLSQQQAVSQFNIKFNFKALHSALNSQVPVRQMIIEQVYKALSVHDTPMSQYFDKRVVEQFEQSLRDLTESTLNRMAGMSGSSLEDSITDVLEEILGSRPFTSFRDIEPQVEIAFDSREDDDMLNKLSRN